MNPETRKLIHEIKECYKVSDLSELNDEQWKEVSGDSLAYPAKFPWKLKLTEEFMNMYADRLNWKILSRNQRLSEKLMEKHINKLDRFYISEYQKLSEPFIEKHSDKLDWELISKYQTLSENFIEKHADKVDWDNIGNKQKLSENFIKKHIEELNWSDIGACQKISEETIEFLVKKGPELNIDVPWAYITQNQELSEPFIEKYTDRFNTLAWEGLAENQKLSKKFILKYQEKLSWGLLFNPKIPFEVKTDPDIFKVMYKIDYYYYEEAYDKDNIKNIITETISQMKFDSLSTIFDYIESDLLIFIKEFNIKTKKEEIEKLTSNPKKWKDFFKERMNFYGKTKTKAKILAQNDLLKTISVLTEEGYKINLKEKTNYIEIKKS